MGTRGVALAVRAEAEAIRESLFADAAPIHDAIAWQSAPYLWSFNVIALTVSDDGDVALVQAVSS